MELHIKRVTEQNRAAILALTVAKSQEGFIETTAQCLEEAREESRFVPVGLYIDHQLIGFSMYGKFMEGETQVRVWLDRLMVDKDYQGRGYGRAFLQKLIHHLYEQYRENEIYLSVYPNNTSAIRLYEQFGFSFTGEVDCNGELLMMKDVSNDDNEFY